MHGVRLSPQQLNELELMRIGAYGPTPRYLLPAAGATQASAAVSASLVAGAHIATLRIPDIAPGRTVTLLDTEATPIATVDVDDRRTSAAGTWIAGPVTMVREPALPLLPELRPAAFDDLAEDATLLLGRRSGALAGTVIVLDEGDPSALSSSVRSLQRDGLDVRVLPRPAAEHVSGDASVELLEHLASVVCASNVVVQRGSTRAPGDGAVVLFTGLSGSGKSTIARQVTRRLRADGSQRVTLLDGDEVRAMLSSGLGFSRADRELNVRRIGWVGSLVSSHGGMAICAPIAPYESMRAEMREMAERVGRFVLVHVATPLEVCEARDRKGLYAAARRGEIAEFTGISDPYETPADADVVVGANGESVEECAAEVVRYLTASSGGDYTI
ncbi:adenylyl-sulfate kinase [Demequina sp. NBRC 110055]|uniref:adenylyl-sulfate kinase n=1 Tax=Demequina sp. NBRC 110055 TaxID=1570344 RepID=UPI001185BE84|nr:adenylyl-sulfate kinase [Demequina sp. NBRC 110055]